MLPFPRFVKLLVRIAKLPSPMFPHPLFQVTGHVCVEYSLGFVCHDVERGLFYDRCTVMDSRLRGNDGGDLCGDGGGDLCGDGGGAAQEWQGRVLWGWGNPWLPFSFSMIILRHSRVGGNPLDVTVSYTDYSTLAS